MMQPFIGITTGEIKNLDKPWSPMTYGQSYTYSDAIIRAGGVPVFIPITGDVHVLRQLYKRLDGLLFAGGNDINPELYNAKLSTHTKHVSDTRDDAEVQLMQWALADHKPIFGICRGMHLLNAVEGGTLYQDIATEVPEASDHQLSSLEKDGEHIAHVLKVDPQSKFAGIIDATRIGANTHHHQAIKDMAVDLKAVAWAEDGIIEAIEGDGTSYVIGVQCHPESLHKPEPKWNLVFESFIKSCQK